MLVTICHYVRARRERLAAHDAAESSRSVSLVEEKERSETGFGRRRENARKSSISLPLKNSELCGILWVRDGPSEVVGETDKEQTVNPMTVVLNLLNVSVLITLTDRTYYVMIVANGSVVESFASCDAMPAVMRVWSVTGETSRCRETNP